MGTGNFSFIYYFIMALTMGVPLFISQTYMEKSSFGLKEVDSIERIEELKSEKYFRVNSFDVSRDAYFPYFTANGVGKHNERLNFKYYIVCPFNNSQTVWYGFKRQKTISSSLNDIEKTREYLHFSKDTKEEFDRLDFQQVSYFEKLVYSDDKDRFIDAIKEAFPEINEKEQIILIPKTDDFENRLGNQFPWIFGSFGIGAAIVFLMIMARPISRSGLNNFRHKKPMKDDILKSFFRFINPRGNYRGTAILLLINIAVFIVMVLMGVNVASPTGKELFETGAVRRHEVLSGEYWRLVSSQFIHGGIMHLMANLIGLSIAGFFVERIIGWKRFIAGYIVCGVLASLASIFWHENTISAGASGAIFGLYGIMLSFLILNVYAKESRTLIWIILAIFPGISLLLGLSGGIDNAAHIGGFIGGFVISSIFILRKKAEQNKPTR